MKEKERQREGRGRERKQEKEKKRKEQRKFFLRLLERHSSCCECFGVNMYRIYTEGCCGWRLRSVCDAGRTTHSTHKAVWVPGAVSGSQVVIPHWFPTT